MTNFHHQPFFIITIDNEGDNLWSKPEKATTKNASYLSRFQNLCELYSLKPTYLTNYEMACSSVFQELGKDVIERKTGEVGMHLHAWDSPPLVPLSSNDSKYHPYLIEYPEVIIDEKIKLMTHLLEDTFQTKMLSHRAGRWAFNEVYAELLIEYGYQVDCSVTPNVSWRHVKGHPDKNGGTDYSHFSEDAYYLHEKKISQVGNSSLLEVPMTILAKNRVLQPFVKILPQQSFPRRVVNRIFPEVHWLRPNGRNRKAMINIVKKAVQEGRSYVEFMLHSSEFMPGGSPTFPNESSIEMLYEDLEALFEVSKTYCQGATLGEFAEWHANQCDRFQKS